MKQPAEIFSLTSTVANTIMGFAFSGAGITMFWLEVMKPGGIPITDLHYFTQGLSAWGALKSLFKRKGVTISFGKLVYFLVSDTHYH